MLRSHIRLRRLIFPAFRVAAIGNNAPVSYGALGAPIIALATVTNVPLLDLSASVGRIVAILALLPPWILIYLVTGRRGLRGIWPLPIVASLSYVLGQFPTSQWLGPYLPDIIGALVSFGALLLLRFWRQDQGRRLPGRMWPPPSSAEGCMRQFPPSWRSASSSWSWWQPPGRGPISATTRSSSQG